MRLTNEQYRARDAAKREFERDRIYRLLATHIARWQKRLPVLREQNNAPGVEFVEKQIARNKRQMAKYSPISQ